MKKEWQKFNKNNQNKTKMARFLKFKFLNILKFNFNGVSILKVKIKIWLFQTVGKKSY